jgi:hypothetical protein
MGDSRFARWLQGGGVFVQWGYPQGGSVTISSCTINGNTANYVRTHAQKAPMAPMGKLLTCLLRDSRFCTTANASVNYRKYVPPRP